MCEEALRHVVDARNRNRWQDLLDEARRVKQALEGILRNLDLDPDVEGAPRTAVWCFGQSLIDAMGSAASPAQRDRVARECGQMVQARDRTNWELLGQMLSIGVDGQRGANSKVHENAPTTQRNTLQSNPWWGRAALARYAAPSRTHALAGAVQNG